MAILSGRNGRVRWAPSTDATPDGLQEVVSLNTWNLSLKTDYDEVTSFGDANKVYVPGMRDISGSVGGFWNSDERALFDATEATVPGLLELAPNDQEGSPLPLWTGPAYMDADITVAVSGAPKVTGNFRAAGSWTSQ